MNNVLSLANFSKSSKPALNHNVSNLLVSDREVTKINENHLNAIMQKNVITCFDMQYLVESTYDLEVIVDECHEEWDHDVLNWACGWITAIKNKLISYEKQMEFIIENNAKVYSRLNKLCILMTSKKIDFDYLDEILSRVSFFLQKDEADYLSLTSSIMSDRLESILKSNELSMDDKDEVFGIKHFLKKINNKLNTHLHHNKRAMDRSDLAMESVPAEVLSKIETINDKSEKKVAFLSLVK